MGQGKRYAKLQYLLQNADGSLAQVTDASVWANMLAIDGDVSNYSGTTDSLQALSNAIDLIPTASACAEIGSFTTQTNLQTLLAALGIPDTLNKPLYTCLVTDRLDNATHGLSALKTAIQAVPGTTGAALASSYTAGLATNIGTTNTSVADGTYGLSALQTLIFAIPTTMVGTNLAFLAAVGGALATAAHSGAVDESTTVMGYIKQMATNSEKIAELSTHVTEIFPAVTNLTCTLTAHANANEYSAYTEVADSAATKLSSVFSACDGHVTGMITEGASEDDTVYMVELSYGASHTIISTWRLVSGTNKVSSTGQSSARGAHIPLGETVYARVMCETAGSKTLNVHFRHFCHT